MVSVEQIETMSDAQFEQFALAILNREIGLYGLARFLRVHRSGTGDYTRDRHQWLDGVTTQDIAAESKYSSDGPSNHLEIKH